MASREDYAKYISTASLLVAVAFMIVGVQSSGGDPRHVQSRRYGH